MINFGCFFPFIFIGTWIFVSYMISKMGWDKLAEKFKANDKFEGKRIGLISMTINSGNYKGAVILSYNHQGIYLKTMILLRLFHPAVVIPWSEIKEARDSCLRILKSW